MLISQLPRLHRSIQTRLSTSVTKDILPSPAATNRPAQVRRVDWRLKYSSARCRPEKNRGPEPFTAGRPLLNDLRLLLYITALGSFFIFIVHKTSISTPIALPSQLGSAAQVASVREDLSSKNMPTDVAPGRPGNLTEEQEIKLREFWQALLKVFGEWHDGDGNTAGENNAGASGLGNPSSATDQDSSQQSSVAVDGKKHKSKLNPFSKKHKSQANDNSSTGKSQSERASSAIGYAESGADKHGLNQSFHDALAQQSPAELRDFFWSMIKHDNPDAILLRFLRARKWNVQAALVMLISALRWRSAEMHVDDDILKNGEAGSLAALSSSDPKVKKEGEDFLQQLRLGKSFLHGYDGEGRPMCLVRVRLHRQGEQSEPSLERFTVYTLETARLLLRSPVDTAVRETLSFQIPSLS